VLLSSPGTIVVRMGMSNPGATRVARSAAVVAPPPGL
jgi:hypothetical protein